LVVLKMVNYFCLLKSFGRMSWSRPLKTSAKLGLIFFIIALKASAKEIIAPTPIPDLFTYLANDKLLAPVLVVTLGHWVTSLVKWAFFNGNKRLKNVEEKVEDIPQILEWMKRMERHMEKLPTEDKIDYKILKALTDREQ
jgi:hypothetical protein